MADALEAVSDIDVELVQRALNALGFRAGVVDNKLGPSTRDAIRRFQYSQVARDYDMTEDEKQSVVTGVLTPRQTVDLFADAAKVLQAENAAGVVGVGIADQAHDAAG